METVEDDGGTVQNDVETAVDVEIAVDVRIAVYKKVAEDEANTVGEAGFEPGTWREAARHCWASGADLALVVAPPGAEGAGTPAGWVPAAPAAAASEGGRAAAAASAGGRAAAGKSHLGAPAASAEGQPGALVGPCHPH